jgi:dipeptidyl aminopeptidase/acylaminoacyl peptidase
VFSALTRAGRRSSPPDSPAALDWFKARPRSDARVSGTHTLVGYFPGISRISLDDGEVQELTDGEGDWAPAWSPDGEKIAFERDGAIWVMNADGSEERVVARPPRFRVFTRPFWLPQAGTEAAARDAS